MNKWREKKWPVLSIIYCLLYSIYCLLYTWNCKIFYVLCVLPLYCLLHRDDKSDTKRWHHDHGLHIKIGHGKSITSQLILTNGLNNVSITRSTPRHADSPRIPTMQCDDHFVPAPRVPGHCLFVKCGGIYEQQALSNRRTRKVGQKFLQEKFLHTFGRWYIHLKIFFKLTRTKPFFLVCNF